MDTEFIFLIACDMPFINKNLLTYMKNTLAENADIYIPYFNNGMIEPLFAFYNKRLISVIEEQIKKKDYKLRSLLSTVYVQYLEERDTRCIDPNFLTFFNVNTKNDFEMAKKISRNEIR